MGLAAARRSRRRCGERRATVLALTVVIAALTTSEAMAVGVWDPNDARGGLDMRWVGVQYPRAGRARLTVAFHGFRKSDLPVRPFRDCHCPNRSLWVYVDEFQQAVFFRKDHGIFMSYGDHASSCCHIYRVRRKSRDTLVVTYRPVDEADPGYRVLATSRSGRSRATKDHTRRFQLGPPPGAAGA
jgi:hypothetical protein